MVIDGVGHCELSKTLCNCHISPLCQQTRKSPAVSTQLHFYHVCTAMRPAFHQFSRSSFYRIPIVSRLSLPPYHFIRSGCVVTSRQFNSSRGQWSNRLHHAEKSVLSLDDSTIYALSTAPGRAAIAVIRISGPSCVEVRFLSTHPPTHPIPNKCKSLDIPLPLSHQTSPQTSLRRRPNPLRSHQGTNSRQYPRLQRPSPLLPCPKHLNRRRHPRTAYPRWHRNHHLRSACAVILYFHHIRPPNPSRRAR